MKQKVFALVVALAFCASFAAPALAESPQMVPTSQNSAEATGIIPFSDEIEIKTRIYNGKMQYRRWNKTQNCWIDPYWIDIP